MNKFFLILIIQLAVFLLYTAYLGSDTNMYAVIDEAFLLGIQVAISLVFGLVFFFIEKTKPWGKALLLSSVVLLVIGFPTCILVF